MTTTSGSALNLLRGDAAKTSIADDEFGLKDIVVALAKVLTTQIDVHGYVLGIEGEWGSGKSSFANFVAEEIKRRSSTHQIIRFEPWLVGEKSALLATFLGQLAKSIEIVQDARMSWWRLDYWIFTRSRKSLAAKVRKYGEYTSTLATAASSAAASDPSGTIAATAVGLKAISWIKRLLGNGPTVDELKAAIASDLRELERKSPSLRFLTVVDDTDRLESAEAMEVLRLVRKVADSNVPSVL